MEPNVPDPAVPGSRRRLRGAGPKIALVAAGVAAGGILAGTLSAGAATSPSTPGTPSGTTPGTAPAPDGRHHPGGFRGLDLTGTVAAVGGSTLNITTGTGTATYQVTGSSDIDKNGEAKLADLKVGDAVRFNVFTGTKTIDKLHAGDEAKDRPTGPPPGGAHGPGEMNEAPGSGTATGGTSSGATTGTDFIGA